MSKHRRASIAGKGGSAGAVLLCVVGFSGAAKGQSILVQPPPVSTTPPAVEEMQEQGMGYMKPIGGLPTIPNPVDLLIIGPVISHPHISYSMEYGTGLEAGPGQQSASFVQTISPGVTFNIGSHWVLDYTAAFTAYSANSLQDTVDHSITINWGTYYDDWSMGFSQTVNINDDLSVQTASQTSTQNYNTSVNASHALNSVLSLDFGVTQSIVDADAFTSEDSWATMEWLNYQFWPRMNAAVGVGAGYDMVSVGPNMTHENLQGRLAWRATDKLSLVIHGGAEDRQYINGGVSDTIDPLYGAAIEYQPFTFTGLSLTLDRATTFSVFEDQVTDNTTLGLALTQRLLEKFSFTAGFGYTITDYRASAANIPGNTGTAVNSPVGREDTTYSGNLNLGWAVGQRATASVFYSYNHNSSSATGFSFSSSQVGLQLGYRF